MLAMPRSLTGVTMVMVLALALVALPLASAKLTVRYGGDILSLVEASPLRLDP
jgi:hypothetical protein